MSSNVPVALADLLSALPHVLRPAQASGWSSRLRLDCGEGIAIDLVIQQGLAHTEEPSDDTPADTLIRLTNAHAADILTGQISMMEALQRGIIEVNNLGDLFQFDAAFDFSSLTETAGTPAPSPEALAELPIGKRYEDGHIVVRPSAIAAFAEATNDQVPVYYGPGAIAPPMMHARLLRDLLFAIMEEPSLGLDMSRLLHASHDVRFHRTIKPWDVVVRRATLDQVEQKRSGVVVRGTLWGFVEGTPAVEAQTTFFIRGQQIAPVGTGRVPRPVDVEIPSRPPDVHRAFAVADDQSHRYAAASLDNNPIHIDLSAANHAGFSDVIVHGLCTMSLSGAALLKYVAFGDARLLRRLAVRWSEPVHNGQDLTLSAWRMEPEVWHFEVHDKQQRTVISAGVAEITETD